MNTITSAERHEKRYQRRKAAREAARAKRNHLSDNYSEVFTYENLYDAYKKCRRNVSWKASVQRYISQAPMNVYNTYLQLQRGKYKSPTFFEFDIYERGKKRHIKSTNIRERVVQRCLCDNALVPVLGQTFIYDNGACMKDKGYDFAIRRMDCHLQKYLRKYGTEGYIAKCDLSSFFDSIPHWAVIQLLNKYFKDKKLIAICEDLISQFDPDKLLYDRRGLGLGSQVSQILAPAVASKVDHFVKDKLGVKFYGRYMDDFYLIHPDKQYLQKCLDQIREECRKLGLTLSEKKTNIIKLTHGFTFLKVRYYVTDSHKIVKKIHPSSVTRQRRKLKKLYGKYLKDEVTYQDVENSFQSWKSHSERFNAYNSTQNMQKLFDSLFAH